MRNPIVYRSLRTTFRLFAATSLIVFGTGCPSDNAIPDHGRVQSEWANTIHELAIVPTFPPREDFQVGDIYVTHFNPSSPKVEAIFQKKWDQLSEGEKALRSQLGMQVRLMQLDIRQELSEEYDKRLSAPSSGFDPNRLDDVPAIALSDAAKAEAASAVKAVKDKIEAEDKKGKAAQKLIDDATLKVATAKTALSRADADVQTANTQGKDAPDSVSTVKNARDTLAASSAAVAEQQRLIDTEADAEKKKTLEREMVTLKAKEAQNKVALDAAVADYLRTLRKKSADATDGVRAAEDDLVKVQQANQTVIADSKAAIVTLTAALAEAQKKLDDAESAYKTLVAAAKLLNVSQPAYANRDLFTGKELAADYHKDHNPSNTSRLRLVGFPDFVTFNFFGADAAAMIPVEAVNLGISLSSQDISGVSVKIPSAESYALPTGKLMTKVFYGDGTSKTLNVDIVTALKNYPEAAAGDVPREYPNSGTKNIEKKLLYLTVVNEVFYARAMDLSVNYSSAGAARLTASLPVGSAPPTTQPNGAPIGPTDSFQAILNNVQSKVGQTQTIPGGSIQVIGGSSFGVGLRRTFDRPVAIGFRGFVIEYDVTNPAKPSITNIFNRIGPTIQSVNALK